MGTLSKMCDFYKNYFDRNQPKFYGEISIENGNLVGFDDKLLTGQYFRIVGSVFNDGIYQYPTTDLQEETFDNGAVWAMAIPKDFLDYVKEVEDWEKKYSGADSAALSPFNSESFGGYSYSKSNGQTNNGYDSNSWQAAFASQHGRWKKLP